MTIPLGLGISEWAVTVTFRCLIGKRCATRQDLLLRTSDSGQPVRPESEMTTLRQGGQFRANHRRIAPGENDWLLVTPTLRR
jgi:hypothetical protein